MELASLFTVQSLFTALALTAAGTFIMRWLCNQPLCNWLLTACVLGALFCIVEHQQILSFYL